jgi:hypothetical protein
MDRFRFGRTKPTLEWKHRAGARVNQPGYADISLTPEVSRDLYLAAAF